MSIKRNQITSFLRMCTHPPMQSSSLGKHLGNPLLLLRQFIFLKETNDPFIVSGQGDTVRRSSLEKGDESLETKPAAISHIDLLSSFHIYLPDLLPAAVCSASSAVLHCWACCALCPQPAVGNAAHCCAVSCLGPQAARLAAFP